jgi:hypothetical protein
MALGAAVLLLSGCAQPDKNIDMNSSTTKSTPLTRSEWDAARAQTVFFAHQSIGDNVLDGLEQIAAREGWPALRVVEGIPPTLTEPMLLHSKVGQNGDPSSKINGFKQAIDAGAGVRAEIALMKFCFWDVRAETDVDVVFNEYRQAIADISRSYPKLTLLHATVPLVIEDVDWRAGVRRLLRRPVPSDVDNARRHALNQKIRAAYGDQLFDIARAEQNPATSPDTAVPYLADGYSSDGAHLNADGRRAVAAAFVRSVAAGARIGAIR